MTIEAELRGFIAALTAVNALVSGRVYQLKFPQAPAYPCARVLLVDEPSQYTHDGTNGLRFAEVQVDAAAQETSGTDPYLGVTALADAIDAGLSGYVGPMGVSSPAWDVRTIQRTARHPTYDPDILRVLRVIQVYTVWYRPAAA